MLEKKINFRYYSSIRIGGVKTLKIAQNIDDVLELSKNNVLIGRANNILISPQINNLFLLGDEFSYINDNNDYIEIGAKTNTKKIFLYFKKQNLKGLEFLGSLPGSIGGVVKMNAGMKEYEIKDMIISICINGKWINNNEINFTYRNSNINGVITAVRLKKENGFRSKLEILFKNMRANQPKDPSCGSCFKNPQEIPAGKLLDMSNLKGYKIGDMSFSQKHANFLINTGTGNFDDAIKLINLAKDIVYNKYKIKLENEIIIIK